MKPVYHAGSGYEIAYQWTVEQCREAKANNLGKFEDDGKSFRLFAAKLHALPIVRKIKPFIPENWPSKEIPGVKFVGPRTVPLGYDPDGKYVLPLKELQCSGSV